MGVVWRGEHVEQQTPVAIKFLTQDGARDPLYLGCLKNEVRKVAGLDHPAIIRVHDHGTVPPNLEEHNLIQGSPYLVMEYAEGGTLSRHCGQLEWNQVWRILMRLLGGLAHAHARGVIHRDLKPGNVLLRRSTGGVVLVDFGLARAGDTDGGAVLNAGTPTYMAPEQIRQIAHDIGPWTDMYALGCLAWSLVCGRPPFTGEVDEVLESHLNEPLPKMSTMMDVPPGFEGWVAQLLRKSPHQRFVRAADATHALAKFAPLEEQDSLLVEPVFTRDPNVDDSVRTESTVGRRKTDTISQADDTQVMAPRSKATESVLGMPGPLPQVGRSLLWAERGELPPIPDDWREDHPPRPVGHLLGTGLGMFGLRSFPLVGREKEQTYLWDQLKICRQNQHTRAVLIEGSDGTGKTYLAEWLARRGYEVGAVIALRAKFQASEDGDPLVSLMTGLIGSSGLQRKETAERIRRALEVLGRSDDSEVEALLTVLGPFEGEQYSPELMDERNEVRFTVIRRLLHRFCVLRPLVVVLDDAQLSADALRLAQTLMSSQTLDHPVMIVMTINPMTIPEDFRDMYTDFKGRKRVSTISLSPLESQHRSTLVRTLLGLEPALASLVERRSGGNPQFAVQLVGDWIQKDMLVQGASGFQMRKGLRPEFPADMQAMWERRLAAALPIDHDTRPLQVAAELGMKVSSDEWEETCEILGIQADSSLMDSLNDANLVTTHPNGKGWTFVHSLVRESLKRQAEFEGHRIVHHRAVSKMLDGREGVSARRGRHLYEAGDLESAVPVLLDGAQHCFHGARNVLGWDLLLIRENALRRLRVKETDLRWAQGWVLKERFLARRKEFPVVMSLVDKILEKTRDTPGSRKLRAMAWHRKGSIHRLMSEPEEARACLNKAMQTALDDPNIMSHAMEQLGTLELAYGAPILAARFYEGALEAAEEMGDMDRIYQVRTNMASVYRHQGDIETAREHLHASLVYYEQSGAKRSQSRCLNDMAELDRFKGDLQRAEEGYLKALSLLEALGDQRFYVAALNLGIIYAETGRPVEARAQLEQCHRALRTSRLPGIEGATLLALAHVHAQLSSIDEWYDYFSKGRKIIEDTGFADIDIARSTQLGGEALLANGFDEQAKESLGFARDHWELLERDDIAAELTDLLSEFES